jgi:YggT family protein
VVKSILVGLVEAYVVVLIVRALLSWIPVRSGSPLIPVLRVLDAITEPLLRPIRRILPPIRAGGAAIDLSILLVILLAEIVVIPILRA